MEICPAASERLCKKTNHSRLFFCANPLHVNAKRGGGGEKLILWETTLANTLLFPSLFSLLFRNIKMKSGTHFCQRIKQYCLFFKKMFCFQNKQLSQVIVEQGFLGSNVVTSSFSFCVKQWGVYCTECIYLHSSPSVCVYRSEGTFQNGSGADRLGRGRYGIHKKYSRIIPKIELFCRENLYIF